MRAFLFERVYYPLNRTPNTVKAQGVISALCCYYLDHFEQMPAEYRKRDGDPPERLVADYRGQHDRSLRDRSISGALRSHVLGLTYMAGNSVELIKDRLDIVDVIGEKVQLKKTGRSFKGLCPFHQEKTPSFVVFPDSQHFHCFGCGKSGDLFHLLRAGREGRLSRGADRAGPASRGRGRD